jgi:hypothetical protein
MSPKFDKHLSLGKLESADHLPKGKRGFNLFELNMLRGMKKRSHYRQ